MRNANHVKFGEACFSKKKCLQMAKHGLATMSLNRKDSRLS